jgi:hypothetical protein
MHRVDSVSICVPQVEDHCSKAQLWGCKLPEEVPAWKSIWGRQVTSLQRRTRTGSAAHDTWQSSFLAIQFPPVPRLLVPLPCTVGSAKQTDHNGAIRCQSEVVKVPTVAGSRTGSHEESGLWDAAALISALFGVAQQGTHPCLAKLAQWFVDRWLIHLPLFFYLH